MSDDLSPTEVSPQLGMSRRDLIRRGAILGGTLVWAAPAVQTFARPAFGQDNNGTPLEGFSYVAVLVECNGTTYRLKANLEDGVLIWECGTTLPSCPKPTGWDAATPAVVLGEPVDPDCPDGVTQLEVSVTMGDNSVTLCVDNGVCTWVEGLSGVIKEATSCNEGDRNGKCITFSLEF